MTEHLPAIIGVACFTAVTGVLIGLWFVSLTPSGNDMLNDTLCNHRMTNGVVRFLRWTDRKLEGRDHDR